MNEALKLAAPQIRTNLSQCGSIEHCNASMPSRAEAEKDYEEAYGRKPKRGILKKNLEFGMWTVPDDSFHATAPSIL